MVPEPNHLLRAARERTPSRVPGECMSRRELVEAVATWLWNTTHTRYDLDTRLLSKWERGHVRWPCAHYRAALRAVLGVATDAELGFWPATRTHFEHRLVSELVSAPAVAAPTTGDDVEGVLMTAADESAQFLVWAESTNAGELTVEQMHSEIRRIAHGYLKAPTLPLFARTKALRDRAFTLLSGHQAPRHTRELYAAAGWSLTVLAWMSVDLGRPDTAEEHARAAWLCAERADYHPLRAWVRATQHTAAFWQNDYTTAAGYAADGLNYTGTGTAELFLSSALALDQARAGDTESATTGLHRAQHVAETAQRAEDELFGPFTCTVDRAESLWSDTHLALGAADEALTVANRAVTTFETTPANERNHGSERMARLQQVKSHVVLGDLRNAEQALQPVLETAPQHRVRPLMHRITEVSAMVAGTGWAADPIARHIRGSITDFHRETVVKELTT